MDLQQAFSIILQLAKNASESRREQQAIELVEEFYNSYDFERWDD